MDSMRQPVLGEAPIAVEATTCMGLCWIASNQVEAVPAEGSGRLEVSGIFAG